MYSYSYSYSYYYYKHKLLYTHFLRFMNFICVEYHCIFCFLIESDIV